MRKTGLVTFAHSLKIFLLLLFLNLAQEGDAQVIIKGLVTDQKNNPLPYANVFIEGTYEGTVTDDSGRFLLTTGLTGEVTIGASYIGMQTLLKKIYIGQSNEALVFRLKKDDTVLTPVTITAGTFAAGDQNKSELLKPRDIGTTAGAPGDLQSTYETLPGTQRVGYTEGLFVRGGSNHESKYIMDGLAMPDPYYSHVPGHKQRGRTDPFLFSGVIFSTGGYSAQYGQALSSVLVLNSKGLADSTITGGGIHVYGATAFHTHRWKNSSIYANASYNNFSPYNQAFRFITHNRHWTKPPKNKDIKLVYRYKPNANGIFKFYSNFSTHKLGVSYKDPLQINDSNFDIKNYYYLAQSNYTQHFNHDKTSVYAGVSVSSNDDKYNYCNTDLNESGLTFQAKALAKHDVSENIKLIAGAEYATANLKGNIDSLFSEVPHSLIALFAESEALFGMKFALRLGFRMEHSSYSKQTTIAPRASFAYKFNNSSQVSFSYGRFCQLPLKYMMLSEPSGLGNEKASHLIANYQFRKNEKTFRAEMYYKTYKELVTEFRPFYNYPGRAGYAKGIEFFMRDKGTFPNLDYWISYSWADSQRKTIIPGETVTPGYVSAHTFSVAGKYWVPAFRVILSMSYNYASKRTFTYMKDSDKITKLGIPAWSSFDVSISKPMQLFGRPAVFFCSLQNVFGYDKVLGYINIPAFAYPYPVYPAEKRSPFFGIFLSMYNE